MKAGWYTCPALPLPASTPPDGPGGGWARCQHHPEELSPKQEGKRAGRGQCCGPGGSSVINKGALLGQKLVPSRPDRGGRCRNLRTSKGDSWAASLRCPRVVGGTRPASHRTPFLWRSLCGCDYCVCVFSCPQAAAVATAERGLLGRRGVLQVFPLNVTKQESGGGAASQSQAELTLAFLFLEKDVKS